MKKYVKKNEDGCREDHYKIRERKRKRKGLVQKSKNLEICVTCVSVILVIMASMIFSALVGYGFFLCSLSQVLRGPVVSLVAALLSGLPALSMLAYLKTKRNISTPDKTLDYLLNLSIEIKKGSCQ